MVPLVAAGGEQHVSCARVRVQSSWGEDGGALVVRDGDGDGNGLVRACGGDGLYLMGIYII